ncbi:MAG: NifU family protein [Rhodospirillales bacterium]|nr:NifU family protein [Alphaproteobacteria bacterium]MBL6948412.1 NifU family protein [Rhodospirillales bacterium]
MFIQTERTPNPATLKFLPGVPVMSSGTANFADATEAGKSPLASGLFGVEGLVGVFLGADFITVTKMDDKDWDILKPQILGVIMEHFQSGNAVIEEGADVADSADLDGIAQQIKELIDTRVRPAVAQDGGDIVYKGFEDGVVFLHMQGACAGCPSSTATLKNGIENMLRHYIPEVTEVRAIN